MAYPGKTIVNPLSGQELKFLRTSKDTQGQLLEMEARYPAHSKEPAPHFHPEQDEFFEVLDGEMTVRIHGGLQVLRKGDKLHIPRGTVHSMWNHRDHPTLVSWKVVPAMDTEQFFETFYGLAAEGKVNASGKPGLLQMALTMNRFNRVFRPVKPPYRVISILFWILTPVAWLAGKKAVYSRYLE
ncbi:MAG: cupin domain-containing protein [Lewinellaceae bacterium]|nr:cupin domain-containing protein [Lewinella sp.]MCB9279339.1 cupin domain-containing protein [Lewinellaceae bacterium]